MGKLISLTENGSNRILSIMIDKILHIEPLTYNDGIKVTIITYINDDSVHVKESYETVEKLIQTCGPGDIDNDTSDSQSPEDTDADNITSDKTLNSQGLENGGKKN